MVFGWFRKPVGEIPCRFESCTLRISSINLRFISMLNFFKKEKKEPKDLKEILKQFKVLGDSFDKLSLEFENFKKEHRFSVQKVGIIRFNPFSEVGGDQSFSIALLDGNDDGLVITSFYTREGNRVYGKPIKNGKSQYAFSQEEIKAIEMAKRSKYYDEESKNNNSAT